MNIDEKLPPFIMEAAITISPSAKVMKMAQI